MMETVDGEYQNCKAFGGAYTREHFFGKYPETAAMVANLSDDDIWRLNRGGHDPHKVYAAYDEAVNTKAMPTVILAKTVKGYGMGASGEALNPTHQTKKLDDDAVRALPRPLQASRSTDDQLKDGAVPFYHPGQDSPEVKYLQERRASLGGYLPQRRRKADQELEVPQAGRPSSACSSPAASARSAPPWPSCRCSTSPCATRSSARASCRSSPTKRAPSAWKACSASSASTRRTGRSTSRSMPTS